jgi:hypothetical protein
MQTKLIILILHKDNLHQHKFNITRVNKIKKKLKMKKKIKTILCATVGTASHQHGLGACTA